jgi:hypothetical protein
MKIFHCDHCDQLIFFENVQCLKCGRKLAFLPDAAQMGSLDPAGQERWKSPAVKGVTYRLCANYTKENVCNWAIAQTDNNPFCLSCRLNRTIPNLSQPGHREAWGRLEVAKRRLMYTLLSLQLPVTSKRDDPARGLAFDFLADVPGPANQVVHTGHADGVITMNIAEADDVEREKRRVSLHEPYRTLLGHFRHEVGHYYWDRLIKDRAPLGGFRERFGDEQRDYGEALQAYYRDGPPTAWQEQFVSAYSAAHPWEDWAETWAHYLHMVDTLEVAASCGLSLKPPRRNEPALKLLKPEVPTTAFSRLINSWFSVTYLLNNLNRGLGRPDGYPFILSDAVIEKLRFVHEVIQSAGP